MNRPRSGGAGRFVNRKGLTHVAADQKVLVIGGGIAGLSAATKLATLDIHSVIVEKAPILGGHAVQYACKATEKCVACAACIVEEKWRQALGDPRIEVSTRTRVVDVSGRNANGYRVIIENSHDSDSPAQTSIAADAIIVATGFTPFDPAGKPYGYQQFANVITNLELERILREKGLPYCPSDNRLPDQIAFVQCVGSRDAGLGHLWCSKVCCASALRITGLIKARRPETKITIFYIDIQTFGKDFNTQFGQLKNKVKMVRAIPADIFGSDKDRLRVVYFTPGEAQRCEESFDMVVLSVGITPGQDNRTLKELFQLLPTDTGFLEDSARKGVFIAGAAGGPMTIADSVASAGRAALRAANHLRGVT